MFHSRGMNIDWYSNNILEIWFLPKLTFLRREIILFVVPTAFPTCLWSLPSYLLYCLKHHPNKDRIWKSEPLIFRNLHFSAAIVWTLRSWMPTLIWLLFAAFSDPLFRSAIASTNARALISTVPMMYPWPSAQLPSRQQLLNTGPKTVPCLTMWFIWNGSVFSKEILTVIIAFLFNWNTKYKISSLTTIDTVFQP